MSLVTPWGYVAPKERVVVAEFRRTPGLHVRIHDMSGPEGTAEVTRHAAWTASVAITVRRHGGCIMLRHIVENRVSACLMMIDHIEIKPGAVGWQQAEPLLKAVWPPEVVAKLPWKDVV